jgi:asparagine synthase (glutamine-hydrolysing)
MCGIAGFVARTRGVPPIDASRARAVLDSIGHRGPDARGEFADGNVWLGHLRLSILDLSSAGNQPMSTRDGRFVITYNGEIYNFKDLAGELALTGMRSSGDSEVALRAFELLGIDALAKLNGMFAFAIFDRQARKLWLVRDRLGIKPLYYRIDSQGLAFGSEIKAIRGLAGGTTVCDLPLLHEWLYYGNTLGGRTLHRGIQQLLPGHCLELDVNSFAHRVKAYWSLSAHVSGVSRPAVSADQAIVETKRLLDAAVRRQLVSDVQVGVFLSGGVDSSAITAIAAKHYPGRLSTYSAGFDDIDGVDERPKARRVAAAYNTDHHELHIRGGDLADLVEKMVHHHDQPFSDAANIPLYLMAREIRGTTKVMLQGDGGDEVFGGYRRYVSLRYRPLILPFAPLARRLPGAVARSPYGYRAQRYMHAYGAGDLASTMGRLLTTKDETRHPTGVFTPWVREIVERADPLARYRECQPLYAREDVPNQMSLVDLTVELPDIFLEKVDRATMAASVEVRVPFLDHDLVDYVVTLPGAVKMPWGRKKWLLKQVLKDLVPDDVLNGPKTGFRVPYGFWVRKALKPVFFDHFARFQRLWPNVLDAAEVERLYTATGGGSHDRADTLWKLLNLMIWVNNSSVVLESQTEPRELCAR